MKITKSIGNNIRKLRLENNLTQAELGNIVHASQQTVAHWENAERNINDEDLKKLCDEVFHVDMSVICKNSDLPPQITERIGVGEEYDDSFVALGIINAKTAMEYAESMTEKYGASYDDETKSAAKILLFLLLTAKMYNVSGNNSELCLRKFCNYLHGDNTTHKKLSDIVRETGIHQGGSSENSDFFELIFPSKTSTHHKINSFDLIIDGDGDGSISVMVLNAASCFLAYPQKTKEAAATIVDVAILNEMVNLDCNDKERPHPIPSKTKIVFHVSSETDPEYKGSYYCAQQGCYVPVLMYSEYTAEDVARTEVEKDYGGKALICVGIPVAIHYALSTFLESCQDHIVPSRKGAKFLGWFTATDKMVFPADLNISESIQGSRWNEAGALESKALYEEKITKPLAESFPKALEYIHLFAKFDGGEPIADSNEPINDSIIAENKTKHKRRWL